MKKIKYLAPLVLLAAFILMGASCSYSFGTDQAAKTLPNNYTNQDWKFSINYPENWSKQYSTEDTSMVTVGFAEILADETQDPKSAVSVVAVTTEAGEESFDAVTEELMNGFNTNESYGLIESSDTTLSGLKAHKVVYTQTQNDQELKFLHYWTVLGNVWYQVLYMAEPDQYDLDIATAGDIFNTFKVLED